MSILPKKEVDNIIETINHIPDCTSLERYAAEQIKKMTAQLQQTLASSQIFALLITVPTNLSELITWVQNFINHYILGPYLQLLALYAEMLADYARILQAVENKLAMIACAQVFKGAKTFGTSDFGSDTFGG